MPAKNDNSWIKKKSPIRERPSAAESALPDDVEEGEYCESDGDRGLEGTNLSPNLDAAILNSPRYLAMSDSNASLNCLGLGKSFSLMPPGRENEILQYQ